MLIPRTLIAFIENSKDSIIDIPEDASRYAKKCTQYVTENPDKIIMAISLLTGLLHASRSITVSLREYSSRKHAERTYYDPHTHVRWDLRRKLTNREKQDLIVRTSIGENVFDILDEFGVL